ncbi:hypothetical protein BC941DRAFT_408684 [Chlamydoabsidia padenii]|nr:hypothetical protein BC941DRAFT_408684 [Chlamydoabsidia padenii]
MAPIEFLLHPPSPKCTLPPILSNVTSLPHAPTSPLQRPSSRNGRELPSIPSLQLPDNKPYTPSLMLTIPYHPSPSSTSSSPCTSPFLSYQSLDTPTSSPSPSFLLPPLLPETFGRSRSHSNASTCSWSPLAVTAPSSPIMIHQERQRRLSDPSPPAIKRKRGRPPNNNSNQQQQPQQRDQYTFVPPTVWDVKRTELPAIDKVDTQNGVMLVLWPGDDASKQQNTFTSTRMDATLTMPKKKRGRKPKTQLAGNSCFVWRDLTARRGANRVKKTTPPRINKKSPSSTKLAHDTNLKIEEDAIVNWTKDLSLND